MLWLHCTYIYTISTEMGILCDLFRIYYNISNLVLVNFRSTIIMNKPAGRSPLPAYGSVGHLPAKITLQIGRGEFIWREKINKPKKKGVRGVPIFFLIGILIFLLFRSPCKISEPYDTPFFDLSNGGEILRRLYDLAPQAI